jgi:8-oxo-dGTP diphosphatase
MTKRQIHCVDLRGRDHVVNTEDLSYRPAAYGFIVHDGCLLLYHSDKSGTWMLPGGGIELGETAIEALNREIQEEVGLRVQRPEFFFADDVFYYNEKIQQAWQVYSLYYRADPVLTDGQIVPQAGAETTALEWIPLDHVRPEDFHVTGMEAVRKFLQFSKHG